jgi:hypothetical protein
LPITGNLFSSPFADDAEPATILTLTNNIIVGCSPDYNCNFAMQMNPSWNSQTIHFVTNIIESGSSMNGYLGRGVLHGGTVTCTGCIDFDTCASIDAAILAS